MSGGKTNFAFPTYPPELQAYLVHFNNNVSYYYWAGIGVMLSVATTAHWFHRLKGYLRRSKEGKRIGAKKLPPRKGDEDSERRSSWRFTGDALHACYRKYSIQHSYIAEAVYLGNLAQIGLIACYLALNFLLIFCGTNNDVDWMAHHSAKLTYANLPLVIGLAGKNNVISKATGFAYESLNVLHRWSARFVIVTSAIHIGGRIWVNVPNSTPSRANATIYVAWGWAAFALFIYMIFAASRPIRNYAYQTFLIQHVTIWFLLVACLVIHRPQEQGWIWAGFALHALDRIGRGLRIALYHWVLKTDEETEGTEVGWVKAMGADTMLVSVRTRQNWIPAQHVYLHCPEISPGGHPFTVSNISRPLTQSDNHRPHEATQELIIRVREGLTRKLFKVAAGDTDDAELGRRLSRVSTAVSEEVPIKAWTEGPYGHEQYLGEDYNTVLLVSGGSGVSYALSNALDLVRRARAMHLGGVDKSVAIATSRLRFVWMVKKPEQVEWIADHLREMCTHAPPEFLHITIFITGKRNADEPDVLAGFVTADHRDEPPQSETHGRRERSSGVNKAEKISHGSVLELRSGRPDFNEIIEHELGESEYNDWIAVGSCGPTPMNDSVADAVSKAICPSRVLKGELRRDIYLTIEEFGW